MTNAYVPAGLHRARLYPTCDTLSVISGTSSSRISCVSAATEEEEEEEGEKEEAVEQGDTVTVCFSKQVRKGEDQRRYISE